MSWFTSLFRPDKIIGQIGGVIDNLHTSDDEKNAAMIKMQELIQQRDAEIEQTLRQEIASKEKIMVAELKHGHWTTTFARPSVIYMGNLLFLYNYAIGPAIGANTVEVPSDFVYAWAGLLSTYIIGRSAEKRGVRNQIVQGITGSKLLD